MIEPSQPLSERNIETATLMSCRREPACFAFLCPSAIGAPVSIGQLNFDIVNADFHRGRASVWATLEFLPDMPEAEPLSLLGFDDGFLRPFARAILEAGATRIAHRMRVSPDQPEETTPPRVVDYVRSLGGTRIRDLTITPYDQVLSIAALDSARGVDEETLFQLPRTDSFLKAFARTAHLADTALKHTVQEMERLGRLTRPA